MRGSKLKQAANWLYGIAIAFLVIVAGLVAAAALPIPGGIKLFTVQSGSMEPAIKTGSIVIVKPETGYAIKDVVTFKNPEDRNNPQPKFTTTHRLVDVKQTDQGPQYQTKGDANDAPDGSLIYPDQIVGKVVFALPLFGYPVSFARTREGLFILVVIPATVIIYGELMSIKNEIIKILQKRKTHEETPV